MCASVIYGIRHYSNFVVATVRLWGQDVGAVVEDRLGTVTLIFTRRRAYARRAAKRQATVAAVQRGRRQRAKLPRCELPLNAMRDTADDATCTSSPCQLGTSDSAWQRQGPLRNDSVTHPGSRGRIVAGDAEPLPNPLRRADTMVMVAPVYWTADMVRALPEDGNRYETVHGELLVSPSPRRLHQRIVTRLSVALAEYLRREPVGEVLSSPADIEWGPDVLVQPDLLVTDGTKDDRDAWPTLDALLLAIEVLSPSSVRADRVTKRTLYQEARVPTCWIVDADARTVEIWAPDADTAVVDRTTLRWDPAGASTPFELPLVELFAD